MNSAEFLDAVRVKHGLTSDYQVAKRFEIPLPSISNYRTGRRSFDDATCIKIASALGEQPLYVIASIKAGRAKCTEVKAVWLYCVKIVKRAGTAAVLAFVVLAGLSAPLPAEAEVRDNVYYGKSRRRRRSLARPRSFTGHITSTAAIAALALVSGCAPAPIGTLQERCESLGGVIVLKGLQKWPSCDLPRMRSR